jgi:hypothetical protein
MLVEERLRSVGIPWILGGCSVLDVIGAEDSPQIGTHWDNSYTNDGEGNLRNWRNHKWETCGTLVKMVGRSIIDSRTIVNFVMKR